MWPETNVAKYHVLLLPFAIRVCSGRPFCLVGALFILLVPKDDVSGQDETSHSLIFLYLLDFSKRIMRKVGEIYFYTCSLLCFLNASEQKPKTQQNINLYATSVNNVSEWCDVVLMSCRACKISTKGVEQVSLHIGA